MFPRYIYFIDEYTDMTHDVYALLVSHGDTVELSHDVVNISNIELVIHTRLCEFIVLRPFIFYIIMLFLSYIFV